MPRYVFALAIALVVGPSIAGEIEATPAAKGRWDNAHLHILVVDGGDVVLVDSAGGIRRQITRTTGVESNPRSARG